MKMNAKGTLMAMGIAGLFLAATACPKDSTTKKTDGGEGEMTSSEMVKCTGVNECKGKGACGNEAHSCAGKNECKGKGWIKISKSDCETKGGEVL